MPTPLAALVMAGGLGTRMKSAVPKHFHPILGRRMVDWVIEAGRASGADPLVVVASPAGRDEFADERRHDRGPGDAARHRRRGPRRACGARGTPETCSCSRATRRCSPPSSSSASSRRITASRRGRHDPLAPSRPTRGSTAASSAAPTAPCCGSPRERRDRRRSARSARSTRRSTSSAPTSSGPRSSSCSRRTCRASST